MDEEKEEEKEPCKKCSDDGMAFGCPKCGKRTEVELPKGL